MSLDFKLHYDRLRENDPTKPADPSDAAKQNTFYESASHARSLCLVWLDGRQHFLNYTYLVGGELTTAGETNTISLNFSAYTVTLSGYQLEPLFLALLDHLPRYIAVIDKRYAQSEAEKQGVVTDIAVVKNDH